MEISDQNLQKLLISPNEQLDIELKPWLDLSDTKRLAEVLECCMALWNTNGGVLIIGFNDKTRKPEKLPVGFGLDHYREDKFMSLLRKHASYQFDVKVRLVTHDGVGHPVICVGSGVTYPVACKTEIPNPNNDRDPFLARNAVYVRSFNNGAVGTTKVLPDDWQRMTRIWFDNLEADIGGFFRRQLQKPGQASEFGRRLVEVDNPPTERAKRFREKCWQLFEDAAKSRGLDLAAMPTFEVAFVIDGKTEKRFIADEDFYNAFQWSRTQISLEPLWKNTKGWQALDAPTAVDRGWQVLAVTNYQTERVDFWRAEPNGQFYCARKLWEEAAPVKDERLFDVHWQILHVEEAMRTAAQFATALGYSEDDTSLVFSFRWRGLEGRLLAAWTGQGYAFYNMDSRSNQHEIAEEIEMPLASKSFQPFVEQLLKPVFGDFGGTVVPSYAFESHLKAESR